MPTPSDQILAEQLANFSLDRARILSQLVEAKEHIANLQKQLADKEKELAAKHTPPAEG